MKMPIAILILLGLVSGVAAAKAPPNAPPDVKPTKKLVVCAIDAGPDLAFVEDNQGYRVEYVSEISCHDLRRIGVGMQTVATSLSIGAAIATASGVGVPVTLGLTLSAGGLSYINFLIGNMDCSEDKAAFQKKVKEAICDSLSSNSNLICIPNTIQIIDENPADLVCREKPLGI